MNTSTSVGVDVTRTNEMAVMGTVFEMQISRGSTGTACAEPSADVSKADTFPPEACRTITFASTTAPNGTAAGESLSNEMVSVCFRSRTTTSSSGICIAALPDGVPDMGPDAQLPDSSKRSDIYLPMGPRVNGEGSVPLGI